MTVLAYSSDGSSQRFKNVTDIYKIEGEVWIQWVDWDETGAYLNIKREVKVRGIHRIEVVV